VKLVRFRELYRKPHGAPAKLQLAAALPKLEGNGGSCTTLGLTAGIWAAPAVHWGGGAKGRWPVRRQVVSVGWMPLRILSRRVLAFFVKFGNLFVRPAAR
jgi:hypothetical protein